MLAVCGGGNLPHLNHPAPGQGTEPIIRTPVFYGVAMTIRPEFESMIYSPDIPIGSEDSPALEQLKFQAVEHPAE